MLHFAHHFPLPVPLSSSVCKVNKCLSLALKGKTSIPLKDSLPMTHAAVASVLLTFSRRCKSFCHSHVKTKCTCGCALTTLKTFMVFTCTGGSNYLVLTVNLKKLESKIYSVSRQTCIFEANFSKFFPHFISTCRTFGDLKGKSDRDRFICWHDMHLWYILTDTGDFSQEELCLMAQMRSSLYFLFYFFHITEEIPSPDRLLFAWWILTDTEIDVCSARALLTLGWLGITVFKKFVRTCSVCCFTVCLRVFIIMLKEKWGREPDKRIKTTLGCSSEVK